MLPTLPLLSSSLRRWLALGLLTAGAVFCPPARAEQAKAVPEGALTAGDILHAVREGQASQHITLEGQLRDDGTGLNFPFRLVANGTQVRYEFTGPPPTAVQVRYNEDNSDLVESGPDGSGRLTPANFDKRILGSDLSYEDLALRFIYWTRAVIEGDDSIRTRSAWKIRLTAPNRRTQYSSVQVWVDKESGGLLRADGYDWQGKLLKRFEVVDVQKIDGKWYLKQMRIESKDTASGRTRSRTYLDIKGVAKITTLADGKTASPTTDGNRQCFAYEIDGAAAIFASHSR